jgi:GNAT superfamily N-acetyltransferase
MLTAIDLHIRDAGPGDAEACGRIFYDAFAAIAHRHAFPVEPDSPEFTAFHANLMLSLDGIVCVVAERDGTVLGSGFADVRGSIAGIGPVSVDPGDQDAGIGRRLMEALLERTRGAAGVRLVQTAYHVRSLALYAKLGFVVREPLSVLQGAPLQRSMPGLGVRPARPDDVPACDALCRRVHGHDRSGELQGAIAAGTARVVERPDRISGYDRLRVARGRRGQRGPAGADRLSRDVRQPGHPRALAQRDPARLVPRQRPAPRAAVDADDRRPL